MRKERGAKSNAEDEFSDRVRAWAKSKDKDMADIARLADKDREKAEFEARARKNINAVNRAVVEDSDTIRASDEIHKAKREMVENEARANNKYEFWEKVDKTRKARNANAKAEAETVQRVRGETRQRRSRRRRSPE